MSTRNPGQFRRIDSVEGLTIRDLNTEGSGQRGCEAIVFQQEHRPPILNEGSDGIHLGGVAIAPAEADEPRIIELWKCKRVPFDTGDDGVVFLASSNSFRTSGLLTRLLVSMPILFRSSRGEVIPASIIG